MKRTGARTPLGMKVATLGIVAAFSVAMVAGCSSNTTSSSTSSDTSAPKGLYESKCSACHSLSTVDSATYKDTDQWSVVVKRMQQKTGDISDSDATTIIDYLANR